MFVPGTNSVSAEIYKFVKDGVVHYTDRPPARLTYTTVSSTAASTTSKRTLVSSHTPAQAREYLPIITRVTQTYGVSAELVQAIIKVESNYNPTAVSPKGALGLMQLMPATATRFGVNDSFDPEQNITGGVKYLCYLFEEFGQERLDLVLAGYNAGEQAVKRYQHQIPPYAETKQYVKKVMALYKPSSSMSPYKRTNTATIYRYVNKNGVVTFTNIPKVY